MSYAVHCNTSLCFSIGLPFVLQWRDKTVHPCALPCPDVSLLATSRCENETLVHTTPRVPCSRHDCYRPCRASCLRLLDLACPGLLIHGSGIVGNGPDHNNNKAACENETLVQTTPRVPCSRHDCWPPCRASCLRLLDLGLLIPALGHQQLKPVTFELARGVGRTKSYVPKKVHTKV